MWAVLWKMMGGVTCQRQAEVDAWLPIRWIYQNYIESSLLYVTVEILLRFLHMVLWHD